MLKSKLPEKSHMRVLLFAYACEPHCGSEAGIGWNWAWNLAELGHEVWVLTRFDGKNAIERELASNPMPNLHIIYVDVPNWIKRYVRGRFIELYAYYAHYLGWQKAAYDMALSLDRKYDLDLVHHVSWSGLNTGSWLSKFNKPFIFGPIGGGQIAPSAFKKYFLNNWKHEFIRSSMVKLITLNRFVCNTVRRADLVLSTNRDTLNLTKEIGAKRVEMFLDVGIPEDYFPEQPPIRPSSEELRLIWVGGIYPRKGLRLALEALSQVKDIVPFKMTILGGGQLSDCVPGWIEEFGLEDRVIYRGRVSWMEVKQEYLNSDAFLFTSLRDSFGMQLIEAMGLALPIITLDHQGAKDFVPQKAGIKVPVTSPTEVVKGLAQAIQYMFEHPQERLQMGRVGYEFAKTESWKQKAIRMSQLYKKVVVGEQVTAREPGKVPQLSNTLASADAAQ